MAFNYSPKITTSGLRTYLDTANAYSYSGTGIDWYDHARSGASGSLVSGFAYDSASKSFYNAAGISTTLTYVSMTPTRSYADQAQYSLEFVVKLRPNAETVYHSLVGNGTSNPWIGIYGNPGSWYMFFRDAPTGAYNISPTITNYNLSSRWATLCFTFAANRTVSFYLNGSLISSAVAASTALTISRLAGGYAAGGTTYHPFQGYLSIYRAYDKTLSAEEVLRNHLALGPRFGII